MMVPCSFPFYHNVFLRSSPPVWFHSSLTAVRCFDNGYAGKQPVAWKEYCLEYWLKELQESMDRCTGCCNITEILFIKRLNPFPNKPWFLRVYITRLLKTLWEKEKLLVTSNFSFSHNVFYLFTELCHLHQI